MTGVDHKARTVLLEGTDGGKGATVAWEPAEIGGRRGGTEVYRSEGIELRAGDRIRWTRNDAGLGLVNSRTAEVVSVASGRVTFALEDGKKLDLGRNDPQLRHLDHAWASTVHAFQGRTVDNVIAAMEARHPHLTTQKSFYVEISRARDRAELVTDNAAELREQLQAVTGERIAALEGIGEMTREASGKGAEAAHETGKMARRRRRNKGRAGPRGSGGGAERPGNRYAGARARDGSRPLTPGTSIRRQAVHPVRSRNRFRWSWMPGLDSGTASCTRRCRMEAGVVCVRVTRLARRSDKGSNLANDRTPDGPTSRRSGLGWRQQIRCAMYGWNSCRTEVRGLVAPLLRS